MPDNRLGRKPDGTFAKGVSGNPGGRPAGIERLIDRYVGEGGEQAIQVVAAIAKGWALPVFTPAGEPVVDQTGAVDMSRVPSVSVQAGCAQWLLERRWGKARQAVDLDVSPGLARLDLSKLSDAEILQLHTLLGRMEEGPALPDGATQGAVQGEPVATDEC